MRVVSTIHKAKGKEWRCVILPALADGLCPADERGAVPGTVQEPDGIAQSPWLEQERRIFYVGLTRARERVYVQAMPRAPSRFLDELRPPSAAPPIRRRPAPPAVVEVEAEVTASPPPTRRARGKTWSAAEKQALAAAWERGDGLERLASQLGRSVGAIAHRVVQLGLADDVDEILLRSGADP